jgi:hypothetical protein
MKRIAASIIVVASMATAGYAFAQDTNSADTNQAKAEISKDGKNFKHGPVDLEKFSRMDSLKAADTNNDGTLSREEIEAFVQKRMVQRAADRMEKRLDVNGDGKITLDEIQKQKAKEFAALDRNDDGKLERNELRAAHHGHHGKHGWHGKHGGKADGWHHKASQQQK